MATNGITLNQVIAFNVRRARKELLDWTQAEAAERLSERLGEQWSVATWSAMERSFDGERIRLFDADLLIALAQTFDVPMPWLFVPPPGRALRLGPKGKDLDARELVDLVVPSAPNPDVDDDADVHLREKIGELFGRDVARILDPKDDAPSFIGDPHHLFRAAHLSRIREWRETLREMDAALQSEEHRLQEPPNPDEDPTNVDSPDGPPNPKQRGRAAREK